MGLGQRRDMGMRRALEGAGREHQHEIDAEPLPVDGAHIADPGRDVAAEHVDDDLVAELELEPVGDLLLDRDQRRAVIVCAPPFAFDDLGALGDFAGIGQAAVALQHPFGIGRGIEIFGLDAARGDDAPAQHRHVLHRRLRLGPFEKVDEAVGLGRGNVDEVERRRVVRQRRQKLPPQIAVDLGDRDQDRQPEAERQHHRRRQRAGPVDVGDRKPQHRKARARQPPRQRHDAGGDAAQQREHHDGGGDEHGRDALVIGKPDHDGDQQRDHDRHQREIAPARAMPFGDHGLAKQGRHRHVMDPAERPQAEGERGQKAIDERRARVRPDAAPAPPAAATACRTGRR